MNQIEINIQKHIQSTHTHNQTLPRIIDEFTIPIKDGSDIPVLVYQDLQGSYPDIPTFPKDILVLVQYYWKDLKTPE